MEAILAFISAWWGLFAVGLFVIAYCLLYWEQAKDYATRFIFMAEEMARKKAMEAGQAKFEWVVANGLLYMPAKLKIFIAFLATILGTTKQELFGKFVQYVFDNVIEWAEAQELRSKKE